LKTIAQEWVMSKYKELVRFSLWIRPALKRAGKGIIWKRRISASTRPPPSGRSRFTSLVRIGRWICRRRCGYAKSPILFCRLHVPWRTAGNIITRKFRPLPVSLLACLDHPAKDQIDMSSWSLTFLTIALLAALLGFSGHCGTAAGPARIVFYMALVIFLGSVVANRRRA